MRAALGAAAQPSSKTQGSLPWRLQGEAQAASGNSVRDFGPLLSGLGWSPHNVGGVIMAKHLVAEVAGELLWIWVACSKALQSKMLAAVTECLCWLAKPPQDVGQEMKLHSAWEIHAGAFKAQSSASVMLQLAIDTGAGQQQSE